MYGSMMGNHQTPFFDSVVNKNTFMNSALSPKNTAEGAKNNEISLNSSMQKYVAGSFRPEKSDLVAPSNEYWAPN